MLSDSDDETLAPPAAEATPEERTGAVAAEDIEDAVEPEAAALLAGGDPAAQAEDAAQAEPTAEALAPEALGPAAALAAVPFVPLAPLPPPPQPKPKPPIRPERLVADSGEVSYRTDGIRIERAQGRAFFVCITPPQGAAQRIYVHAHAFEQLLRLSEGPVWETGRLWKALCEIPLDRPLPSRRLEEELRALLTTFAGELSR